MTPSTRAGSAASASILAPLIAGTGSSDSTAFAPGSLNQSPLSPPSHNRPAPSRASLAAGFGGSGRSTLASVPFAGS